MTKNCEISDLCLQPDLKPLVSSWIYNEFWTDVEGVTEESLSERFSEAVSVDQIPLALIAFAEGKAIGTVSLIESDDDDRPHLSPWLAALYVLPEFRNQGAGAFLVEKLLQRAKGMGINEVYLGTSLPQFYTRMGAVIVEQASDSFFILKFAV